MGDAWPVRACVKRCSLAEPVRRSIINKFVELLKSLTDANFGKLDQSSLVCLILDVLREPTSLR